MVSKVETITKMYARTADQMRQGGTGIQFHHNSQPIKTMRHSVREEERWKEMKG
jgi:hypothetical protein